MTDTAPTEATTTTTTTTTDDTFTLVREALNAQAHAGYVAGRYASGYSSDAEHAEAIDAAGAAVVRAWSALYDMAAK